MTFFEIENVRSVLKAKWLRRPEVEPKSVMTGIGIDSRVDLTGKIFVAIKGQSHDGHAFLKQAAQSGAEWLVVESHAVTENLPPNVGVLQVENTRKSLAKLALAYRRSLRSTKVIAVTGSAGKTTTKRLIDSVLSQEWQGTASPKSFNNDIGLPLTILQASPADKYLLVEIGMNAPGEIAQLAAIAEPDLVVITSIGRAHLGGLGSVEAIANEKASILTHLKPEGVAILNADAPLLRPHFKRAPHRVLFGESEDADLRMTDRGDCDGVFWFEINDRQRFEINLPGKHNAMNAMAAVAVGRRLGLSDETIAAGLKQVQPAAMRMTAEHIGGITLFNDAYNANPDSMAAALETFSEITPAAKRRIVILGDMLELGDTSPQLHREVAQRLIAINLKCPIEHAVLIGEQSMFAAADLSKQWSNDRVTAIQNLDGGACKYIAGMLRAGDAVLMKASRGMGLERIVPAIQTRFGDDQEDNARTTTLASAGTP